MNTIVTTVREIVERERIHVQKFRKQMADSIAYKLDFGGEILHEAEQWERCCKDIKILLEVEAKLSVEAEALHIQIAKDFLPLLSDRPKRRLEAALRRFA